VSWIASRPSFLALPAMAVALFQSGCGSDTGAPPAQRSPLAAQQQVDAAALESARLSLASSSFSRCLLVERNGTLVMEEYFNGANADSVYDVRSVTKSVTATLVGIALDKGLLRDLDQTVGEFLDSEVPGLQPGVRAISLRHLLTMSSGLPWHELGATTGQDYTPWVTSADQLRWILEKPLEAPPGEYWNYNTGASHITSAILTEATGQSARVFAQEQLFGPLEASIGGWPVDSRGYNFGGHGIALSGRTLIKLGRLYLDGGSYRGRQIVPAAWLREATRQHYSTRNAVPYGSGYGYCWWVGSENRAGRAFYFANGYGGQFIVNVPSANATIVATMAWTNAMEPNVNWNLALRSIVETIVPGLN